MLLQFSSVVSWFSILLGVFSVFIGHLHFFFVQWVFKSLTHFSMGILTFSFWIYMLSYIVHINRWHLFTTLPLHFDTDKLLLLQLSEPAFTFPESSFRVLRQHSLESWWHFPIFLSVIFKVTLKSSLRPNEQWLAGCGVCDSGPSCFLPTCGHRGPSGLGPTPHAAPAAAAGLSSARFQRWLRPNHAFLIISLR